MIDGPRVAPASGAPAKSLVILLHGYGSNGDDLISLAPHWRGALPTTAFVAPNAPEICPGAPDGYQWWPITSLDRNARAAGAARAAPVLDAFIDAELARHGLTEANLALVGFSQGTMMALHGGAAPDPPDRRESSAIPAWWPTKSALATAPTHPPVLLIHGDADPDDPDRRLPPGQGRADAANGFAVESHVSPGLGHSLDLHGLHLGERFLSRVLG